MTPAPTGTGAGRVWEPLHARFARWAATAPERTALVCPGGPPVTYGQLHESARSLAADLRVLGAGPGTLVGVAADRSPAAVAAIIAVMTCGAGYVPLDPVYPPTRLRQVAEDCALALVVGTAGHQRLAGDLGLRFAAVEAIEASHSTGRRTERRAATARGARPDDCAYVIHTSGSTGRPKGVVIPHRNLPQLFDSARPLLGFGPDDVWTAVHSFSFDFSVWEIWGALAHGAALVLVPPVTARDPDALWDLLREHRVTVLSQTPTAFASLMERAVATGHPATGLRLVVFGGEELRPATLAPWYRGYPDDAPRLVNMYGTTETTVHVTHRTLTAADTSRTDSPLGAPLPGVDVLLLGPDGESVPPGAAGEMYVAGPGVATGYLKRPELDRARFVPDSHRPGRRMYRTGDLARSDGGELVYLGRLDRQVQLRGFRIEPAEIETALTARPGISRAVATVRTDPAGDDSLLAHVLPEPGTPAPDPAALRTELAAVLPAHLVPRAVIVVDDLPLTPQGKIDTSALPTPWGPPTETATPSVPLTSPTPAATPAHPRARQAPAAAAAAGPEPGPYPGSGAAGVLARAWQQVLGIALPRPGDDFFALGGDSIHAVRVTAAARTLGLHLTVSQIYAHPRLADLAHALTASDRTAHTPVPAPATAPATEPGPVQGQDHRVSAGQAGILYDCEADPDPGLYRILACLTLTGPCDPAALRQALADTARRHPALRGYFTLAPDGPRQHTSPHPQTPLTLHGSASAGPPTQRARRHRAWAGAVDPYRPSLLHCHLLPHTDGSWELALVVHHAVLDGWSLALVLDEITHRYADLLHHRPPATTAVLPATWQHLDREEQARTDPATRAFWDEKLTGHHLAPLPALPPSSGPRTSSFTLDPATTDALLIAARRLAVPARALFTAAQLRATADLCDTSRPTVGAVFHHRPETADGARAVGMFLTTLPLTVPLTPDTTWQQLLTAAFDQERAVTQHRWTPLADLTARHGPLLHTVVNYTDFRPLRRLADYPLHQVGDWLLDNPTAFPLYTEIQRHPSGGHCTVTVTAYTPATPHHATLTAAHLQRSLHDIATSCGPPPTPSTAAR
ncbi:amino acid adenylation domain-containing protein [Kitasatospora purpeofusca]|uniref:amino acid adenylation domain-containing protein n=1 Tax=Kitasatospora purpeofusca TaxID=67352 RepID=UPI0036AD7FF9